MADIRNVRHRPGVRIYLHPADIVDTVLQPDVLQSLNEEEMQKIVETMNTEISFRQHQSENRSTENGNSESRA